MNAERAWIPHRSPALGLSAPLALTDREYGPVQKLYLAVLMQALWDIGDPCPAVRGAAVSWLLAESAGECHGFAWICELLGYDHGTLLRLLRGEGVALLPAPLSVARDAMGRHMSGRVRIGDIRTVPSHQHAKSCPLGASAHRLAGVAA